VTMEIILYREGKEANRFSFDRQEVSIGRETDNDIVIDSSLVSRHHAKLELREGQIFITDLNSSNGTWINGERIKGCSILSENGQANIGEFSLQVLPSSKDDATVLLSSSLCLEIIFPKNEKITITIKDGEKVVVGRQPDCDVVMEDNSVSGRHASVSRKNGRFMLADMGSTNGTLVNGEKIEEAELQDGDIIQFGRYKCKVCLSGETKDSDKVIKKKRKSKIGALFLMLALVSAFLIFMQSGENKKGNGVDEAKTYSEEFSNAVSLFEAGQMKDARDAFWHIADNYPERKDYIDYLEALELLNNLSEELSRFYSANPEIKWEHKDELKDVFSKVHGLKDNAFASGHKFYKEYLEKTGESLLVLAEMQLNSRNRRLLSDAVAICEMLVDEGDLSGNIKLRADKVKSNLRLPEPPSRPSPPPPDNNRVARQKIREAADLFNQGSGAESLRTLDGIPATGVSDNWREEERVLRILINDILRYRSEERYYEIFTRLRDNQNNRYFIDAKEKIDERKNAERIDRARVLHSEAERLFNQKRGGEALTKLEESLKIYSLSESNSLKGKIERILLLMDNADKSEDRNEKKRIYGLIIKEVPNINMYGRQAAAALDKIKNEEEQESRERAEKLYSDAEKLWDEKKLGSDANIVWDSGNSKYIITVKKNLLESKRIYLAPETERFLQKADAKIEEIKKKQRELYQRGYALETSFSTRALETYREIIRLGIPDTEYYNKAVEGVSSLTK
jgi:pSer/pThr/pTyr-binding forkhead associated (FHA) protein